MGGSVDARLGGEHPWGTEIGTAPQKFEKREVKTGLSDGIQVSGLVEKDKVKGPPEKAEKAKTGS